MHNIDLFFSSEVNKSGKEKMNKVKAGEIRNHKLLNSAPPHHGSIEHREKKNFVQFLSHKNFYTILSMRGSSYYE